MPHARPGRTEHAQDSRSRVVAGARHRLRVPDPAETRRVRAWNAGERAGPAVRWRRSRPRPRFCPRERARAPCSSSAERKSSNGAPCAICRYRLPDDPKLTRGADPPLWDHERVSSGNTWRRLAAAATSGGPPSAVAASASTSAKKQPAMDAAARLVLVTIGVMPDRTTGYRAFCLAPIFDRFAKRARGDVQTSACCASSRGIGKANAESGRAGVLDPMYENLGSSTQNTPIPRSTQPMPTWLAQQAEARADPRPQPRIGNPVIGIEPADVTQTTRVSRQLLSLSVTSASSGHRWLTARIPRPCRL